QRGLDVVADRAGNLWAWTADPDAGGPGLVLGSHLDSVPDGGAFDGPLGIVSAFAALDQVDRPALRRPVGIACFADEEGARLGRADHAGTTRLADRDDPMLALAAAVLAARAAAERHGTVATIGKLRVHPNGVNAIPSQVTAWLDARGPLEDSVRSVVAGVGEAAGTVPVEESWTPPTGFDAVLRDRLSDVLGAPVLPTGAGHDAGILATAGIPTAMLFVRN